MRLRSVPRPVLPVFVALLAAGIATGSSWPPLFATWLAMADYQHGWFVALIIIAWLYRSASSLPPPTGRFSLSAAALLLAALLLWLVAYRALSGLGQQILLPPILWLTVWTACGWPAARRIAAPLGCLYFVIPVWELLLPSLQHLAVLVTETIVGGLGVPVSIDGVFVTIPEGTFQIAEGCAGKRYLIVALTVAGLLAGTQHLRPRRSLLLLGVTALLALLANWLRIMMVIYAGHATDMQSYLVTHEHISLGWVLFALLIALVCLLGTRLARDTPAAAPATPPPGRPAQAPVHAWRGLSATALLLCLPSAAQLYARSVPVRQARDASISLPASAAPWSGPLAPDARWEPQFPGASSAARGAYRSAAGEVQIFLAQYQTQSEGAKLVSFDNKLFAHGWVELRTGTLDTRPASAGPDRIAALWVLAPSGERWLISYVFEVGSFVTSSPIAAQLVYGTWSWRGTLPSRLLAIAARCEAGCESAQRAVAAFWAAGPQLLR